MKTYSVFGIPLDVKFSAEEARRLEEVKRARGGREKGKRKKGFTEVERRILDALDSLGSARLAEIARCAGFRSESIHHQLKGLVRRGYVERYRWWYRRGAA